MIKFIKKVYIYIHMKICKLTGKKMIKEYLAIYKYKNKIGYFINATGFNKKDAKEKVRTIVYHSDFFNGIKNKKEIEVILIENGELNEWLFKFCKRVI